MKLATYENMSVKLAACTGAPERTIKRALSLTTGKAPGRRGFLKSVWDMGHESAFEHVVFSFLVKGLSRSAVMQLTRHRLCSFTVSSQHYQGQEGSSMAFSREALHRHGAAIRRHTHAALTLYKKLRQDLPKEEARQVLPGAVRTTLMWTVNARELALFLRLRRCRRNVGEMRVFAERILATTRTVFPLIGYMARLDCETMRCRQGPMRCNPRAAAGRPK